MRTLINALFFTLILGLIVSPTQAQQPKELDAYIDQDVIGIGYCDLKKTDVDSLVTAAKKIGLEATLEIFGGKWQIQAIQKEIANLKSLGVNRIYFILRTSDIQAGGTSLVVPVNPPIQASNEKVDEISMGLGRLFTPNLSKFGIGESMFANRAVQGSEILLASTDQQIELLQSKTENVRNYDAAWEGSENGSLGLILFGNADSRRVIRELLTNLPVPAEKITGQILADKIEWTSLQMETIPMANLTMSVQTKSPETASLVQSEIAEWIPWMLNGTSSNSEMNNAELKALVELIQPVVAESKVTLSTNRAMENLDRIAKGLSTQIKKAQAAAAEAATLKQLRSLTLAMHNYESAYRKFPTQVIADPNNGAPLLSWRVQILPFLGEVDLFNKFKLDQPWDSEDNIKLIREMPEIYWNPDPNFIQQNRSGKTVFQVAAGPGLMFNGAKEITFGKITDGSSNTMLIASVPDTIAVPWTKPVDWNVDLEKPTELLKDSSKPYLLISRADGSVQRTQIKGQDEQWSFFLQPADGNIVSIK
ncbi:MAG: DUF1559 domain-containing protein [Planctomycetota bacterium]